eukprot:jgi/Phyca11/114002/e_gw1.25.258.1
MELAAETANGVADLAWQVVWDSGPRCLSTVTSYWKEIGCALVGILVWTILEPLLSVGLRFVTAIGLFVSKWAGLTKLCLRKYRRFVCKRAVSDVSRCDYYWSLFEALWATPMVILEAHKEHRQGLGRLLHKWIVAYHELWCVFLPNSIEFGWTSTKKYGGGVRLEWWRTVGRAGCLFQGLWSVTSLLFFGCFYGVVCCYEVVEWICQGWKGLTVLVIAANVYFSAETELDEGRRFSVNPDLLRASWCVLFVGFISHTWRWYEASAGERTP